jgi:hypothetical protein
MKAVNPQNQVQAGNLGANGGALGAMVGMYARKKDYETRYAYRTSLMEFDDQLAERRQLTGTVHKIVADQVSQASANEYATVQEAARARNKIGEIEATGTQKLTQIKAQGSQDRRTHGYRTRTDQKALRDQTAGLETASGMPLSGGISVHVIKPGENAGQLQALQNTDVMKGQSGRREKPAESKPTNFTGASGDSMPDPGPTPTEMPTAAKGGKGKKVKPFADPSVERNVKPVPDTIASPFSAPATRSTIFADASSPKTNTTTTTETPNVATPKARIKKA